MVRSPNDGGQSITMKLGFRAMREMASLSRYSREMASTSSTSAPKERAVCRKNLEFVDVRGGTCGGVDLRHTDERVISPTFDLVGVDAETAGRVSLRVKIDEQGLVSENGQTGG